MVLGLERCATARRGSRRSPRRRRSPTRRRGPRCVPHGGYVSRRAQGNARGRSDRVNSDRLGRDRSSRRPTRPTRRARRGRDPRVLPRRTASRTRARDALRHPTVDPGVPYTGRDRARAARRRALPPVLVQPRLRVDGDAAARAGARVGRRAVGLRAAAQHGAEHGAVAARGVRGRPRGALDGRRPAGRCRTARPSRRLALYYCNEHSRPLRRRRSTTPTRCARPTGSRSARRSRTRASCR